MTIKILSKDNDLVGTDKYRDDNKLIPIAYRHTIDISVNPNASGTNNMVTVKSTLPLVNVIDGVSVSKDSFLMTTKFSALQHVTNDVERAKIFDKHLEMLGEARASILDGELSDAPLVLTA